MWRDFKKKMFFFFFVFFGSWGITETFYAHCYFCFVRTTVNKFYLTTWDSFFLLLLYEKILFY